MKDNFKFIGKTLYFPERKVLVLGDLHLGWEESLNEQGIFVPRRQFQEIVRDLNEVFEKIKKEKIEGEGRIKEELEEKIKEIVVLGDLKHEFGEISEQEWREVKGILDIFKAKAEKVVLVRGNHDTILGPIAERKELNVVDYYIKEEICFLHGDKIFPECLDKKIKMLVMAHRHPAVVLSDDYKKEKYKCFLVGKWKSKKIAILPSFFPFVEGMEVANLEDNGMFIPEEELKEFKAYVVGDEVYKFGKVGEIV
ncbi:hypothetical protein A3K73_06965 [Candidatus Pacearchaeota archaeon RBG_13_36_9]|nr:MAG: hypothetical protein A3K73_06965 [Candidatus Pacearchaeota archaeon RBG_13_36_9]